MTRKRKEGVSPALESVHQVAVAKWLDHHEIAWWHTPNGGKRNKIVAANLKREGVKAGVVDVIIIDPPPNYPDLVGSALELKREDGGTATDSQKAWLKKFSDRGWATGVFHGAKAMIEHLEKLGYGASNGS